MLSPEQQIVSFLRPRGVAIHFFFGCEHLASDAMLRPVVINSVEARRNARVALLDSTNAFPFHWHSRLWLRAAMVMNLNSVNAFAAALKEWLLFQLALW